MFGFNFAPTGWATCDGQLLPISQNTALFSLLGTYYGGDGKSTFALPNLQDNAAMHSGQGQGLSERFIGEMSGSQTVTLLTSEMPAHTHALNASNNDAAGNTPANNHPAKSSYDTGSEAGVIGMYTTNAANLTMAFQALSPGGGSLPHNNMQPSLVLNFCIALQGVYPARP